MGIYSIKENLYAEFAQQKTKPKKVKDKITEEKNNIK